MFTGIVQGMGQVTAIEIHPDFRRHQIWFPESMRDGLEVGASVANNGCCLTITEVTPQGACFDLIDTTLALTNLGALQVGEQVNLERAARFGDEIGGHSMSGHIHDQVEITRIERSENNCRMYFALPKQWQAYVFDKGYIGLDGASLTVASVNNEKGEFSIGLIPETLQRTVFGSRLVGDKVNLEIDPQTQVIVDTVERFMRARQP